jgi:hypothetical protein
MGHGPVGLGLLLGGEHVRQFVRNLAGGDQAGVLRIRSMAFLLGGGGLEWGVKAEDQKGRGEDLVGCYHGVGGNGLEGSVSSLDNTRASP